MDTDPTTIAPPSGFVLDSTPPPPDGFKLDVPPPPEGFQLDSPPEPPAGFKVDAPAPPAGFVLDNFKPAYQWQQSGSTIAQDGIGVPPVPKRTAVFGTDESQEDLEQRAAQIEAQDNPSVVSKLMGSLSRVSGAAVGDLANVPAAAAGYTKPFENLRSGSQIEQNEEPLPVEKRIGEEAKDMPVTATVGKIGMGLGRTAPLMAVGLAPAWMQPLVSLGFSASMIKSAGPAAAMLGEELGKPPGRRDKDKLTTAISDLIQTGVFAPMAGVHGVNSLVDRYSNVTIPKLKDLLPKSDKTDSVNADFPDRTIHPAEEELPQKNAEDTKDAVGDQLIQDRVLAELRKSRGDQGSTVSQPTVIPKVQYSPENQRFLDEARANQERDQAGLPPVFPEAVPPPDDSGFATVGNAVGDQLDALKAGLTTDGKGDTGNPVSVPLMITRQMEADLRARGYSQDQVNAMKPQEANDILRYGNSPVQGSVKENEENSGLVKTGDVNQNVGINEKVNQPAGLPDFSDLTQADDGEKVSSVTPETSTGPDERTGSVMPAEEAESSRGVTTPQENGAQGAESLFEPPKDGDKFESTGSQTEEGHRLAEQTGGDWFEGASPENERTIAQTFLPAFDQIDREVSGMADVINSERDVRSRGSINESDEEAKQGLDDHYSQFLDNLKDIQNRVKGLKKDGLEFYFRVKPSGSTVHSESVYVSGEAVNAAGDSVFEFPEQRFSRHGSKLNEPPSKKQNAPQSEALRTILPESLKTADDNQIQAKSRMVQGADNSARTLTSVNDESLKKSNKVEPTPEVARAMMERGTTVRGALKVLAGSGHRLAPLWENLLRNGDERSLGTQVVTDGSVDRSFWKPGRITMAPESLARALTVTHEIVHGLTATKMGEGNPIQRLMEQAKPFFDGSTESRPTKHYAFSDSRGREFLAEAISNPGFQKELDSIKLPGKEAVTVWQKLVQAVQRLLGIAPRNVSLLDEVLRHAAEVMRSTADGADNTDVLKASNATVARKPGLVRIGGDALQEPVGTAYHGTPHKVGRFSTDKIGTGEGAQVYGYGLYFAENPEVARNYRESLGTDKYFSKDGRELRGNEAWAAQFLHNAEGDMARAREVAKNTLKPSFEKGDVLSYIEKFRREGFPSHRITGNEYTVHIAADDGDLLDWDKPLSEQSAKVKAALEPLREEYRKKEGVPGTYYLPDNATGQDIYRELNQTIFQREGGGTYRDSAGNPKAVSEKLAELGIKGVQYLDQGSRDKGSGTRNYVMFDDKDIRITHENGHQVALSESQGSTESHPTADILHEPPKGTEPDPARVDKRSWQEIMEEKDQADRELTALLREETDKVNRSPKTSKEFRQLKNLYRARKSAAERALRTNNDYIEAVLLQQHEALTRFDKARAALKASPDDAKAQQEFMEAKDLAENFAIKEGSGGEAAARLKLARKQLKENPGDVRARQEWEAAKQGVYFNRGTDPLSRSPVKQVEAVYRDLQRRGLLPPSKSLVGPETGRTLGKVTDYMTKNQIDSPKRSFRERLALGQGFAERVDAAKNKAQWALARVKGGWAAMKSLYEHPTPDSDFTKVVKDWIFADQRTGLDIHRFAEAIRSTVENPTRRKAMSVWLDAGGDETILRSQLSDVPELYKPIWEAALKLTDTERGLAESVRQEFETKADDGVVAGLLDKTRADYGVPQRWKVAPKAESGGFEERHNAGNPQMKLDPRDPFFSFARSHESYFDGIMAGGVPENLDIGHLVTVYDQAFHKSMSSRGAIAQLRDARAVDGLPVVKISGSARPVGVGEGKAYLVDSRKWNQSDVSADGRPYRSIDHFALKDWKIAFKDEQGHPIIVKGDFLVHPDHYEFLRNELQTSALRDESRAIGRVVNPIMKSNVFLKSSKLAFAGFHLATIGEHMASHLANPFPGKFEIDLAQPDQAKLVRNGLEIGMGAQRAGFEEGLASHGGLFAKVPGLGDASAKLTDWMFKEYIPKIMMKVALNVLGDYRTRYAKELARGEITDDQLAGKVADQMNAGGGVTNYRLAGASKELMDLTRLAALAPQFLAARARVVAQAFAPYGHAQRKLLIVQAFGMYVAARILNKLTDDDPHWEPKNAFSWIHGGRAYSIRTIVGDALHLFTDPASFAAGRLSPGLKLAIETMTQQDMRTGARKEPMFQTDIKLSRVAQNFLADLAKWAVPSGAEGLLPGSSGREQNLRDTALASFGVGSRKYTARSQIYDLARTWAKNSDDAATRNAAIQKDGQVFGESPYRKLEATLDAGDVKGAQTEYDSLVKNGHSPKSIEHHFTADTAAGQTKPFTGSEKKELQFVASLTPQQQMVYNKAAAERVALEAQFDKLRK